MRCHPIRPQGLTLRHSIPFRIAVVTALGALLLLATAVGTSADPSVKDKRAQAEAILAEIQALDEEVGAAAERYNGANYELQQLTVELADTRQDLTRARKLLTVAQRWLEARVRELYVSGPGGSALEVILGARSLDEVIDRLEFAERVGAQDARIAEDARALRDQVAAREEELKTARARQATVVEQRAAEVRAIEGKLAERQRLFASVKDEIARLEEAERRRQAQLRREARLELERQRREAAEALAGHMGMYIGGGNFVHAPRTGDVVKISSLSEPYYVATWVGARRVL